MESELVFIVEVPFQSHVRLKSVRAHGSYGSNLCRVTNSIINKSQGEVWTLPSTVEARGREGCDPEKWGHLRKWEPLGKKCYGFTRFK